MLEWPGRFCYWSLPCLQLEDFRFHMLYLRGILSWLHILQSEVCGKGRLGWVLTHSRTAWPFCFPRVNSLGVFCSLWRRVYFDIGCIIDLFLVNSFCKPQFSKLLQDSTLSNLCLVRTNRIKSLSYYRSGPTHIKCWSCNNIPSKVGIYYSQPPLTQRQLQQALACPELFACRELVTWLLWSENENFLS